MMLTTLLLCLSQCLVFVYASKIHHHIEGVAMILEVRPMMQMVRAVFNVLSVLPPKWIVQIYYGDTNYEFLTTTESLKRLIDIGKIQLLHSGINDVNYLKDGYVLSEYLYSNLSFWNSIAHENILVFQSDSTFCSGAKHSIHYFLQYSYIGAPWPPKHGWMSALHGGNGGTSFRKKSVMIKCSLAWIANPQREWEDVYFSACVENHLKLPVPTRLDQQRFGTETYHEYDGYFEYAPFSYHRGYLHSGAPYYQKMLQNCPEIAASAVF